MVYDLGSVLQHLEVFRKHLELLCMSRRIVVHGRREMFPLEAISTRAGLWIHCMKEVVTQSVMGTLPVLRSAKDVETVTSAL